MLRTRIIPSLLLQNESLVKTTQFGSYCYVGDPCNTVRIFNELEVDELLFLDITATKEKRAPNLKILRDIADECFMPLGYGGGITSFEQAKNILAIGFEKIVVNSAIYSNPDLITKMSEHFGSQAVMASIDVRRDLFGHLSVYSCSGTKNEKKLPVEWAQELEQLGVGEILLTSVDREGTWSGFDTELVQSVANNVTIPVIAHGGAGNAQHIHNIIQEAKASAVALGSMVVFQKKGMGVLVNFPDELKRDTI
jgi:cyclase